MDPIIINESECTGCGKCVDDCISRALRLEGGVARYTPPCLMCGHCVAICPQNAVTNTLYDDPPVEFAEADFSIPSTNMINAIKFRRSVRNFEPRKIEPEHLRAMIIEGAGHAPTAKNNQQVRFFIIEDELKQFKEIVWNHLRKAHAGKEECALGPEVLANMIALKDAADPAQCTDYLFRNAPCVICMDGTDKLDVGLAASALEMVGTTFDVGVLYNGFLRRVINGCPEAKAFLNADPDLHLDACLLAGYPAVHYQRTAPRRRPSIYLR